jgi:hypothetical protein
MTTQITTDNISPTTLEVLGSAVPKVSTIAYPGDDTAANPAGGDTITLTGTGFVAGATVIINGTSAGVVTVVSGTTLTFTAPASSAGTYVIYVINSDGGTAIVIPGISYSGLPNWSTGAGSLGNIYEVSNVNTTVVATGDVPITYSLYSGNLPTGSNINGSTGLISGTAPAAGSPTTYSFVIKATDNEQQDTNRSFSLTINPDTVTWINPANASVTTSYEYANISNVSLSANTESNTSVSFSQSGLPAGLSLTGNTISGSSNTVANTSVTLTATGNVAGRTATRTVYFDVQQDVVTWSSPANNTTYESFTNSAISNVSLSASSAGGQSITYTANTLPTGVSVSGSVISGTATDAANTTTLLTATSALSNRTATRTINWVISVANDTYFKNVTLLLNGETTALPFISDSSTNSFALTINGDTKPNNFNPYTPGYYSNFFDGTGDYLTIPNNSAFDFGTGDVTIECWFLMTADPAQDPETNRNAALFNSFIASGSLASATTYGGGIDGNSSSGGTGLSFAARVNGTNQVVSYTGTVTKNVWHHYAFTRTGTTANLYLDGIRVAQNTSFTNAINTNGQILKLGGLVYAVGYDYFFPGYISNARILKGTALYTGTTFTPSTTPLTAIANTSLLICQSNRLIDNSTNNFTITKVGDVAVSPAIPFTQNSSYSTYGSTYFDGTGDYLLTPSSSSLGLGSGDFTIESWVYIIAHTNADGCLCLNWTGSWSTNNWSLHTDHVSANEKFTFWVNNYSSPSPMLTSTTTATINMWHHVAVTRSGNTWRLFVNGNSEATVTSSVALDNGSSWPIYISGAISGQQLNGYISNLRVVKGTAVYTTAFTPPTSPLTAITNTSLLTLQYNQPINNNVFLDQSNFNNIITRNGNTSQGTFSPYSVTGWSNYFDGTGDYLTVPSNSAFAFGTGEYTVEAWIYLTAYDSFESNIFGSASSAGGFGFAVLPTGRLQVNKYGTGNIFQSNAGLINLNTWYHIAASRTSTSANSAYLFVNGSVVTTATDAENWTVSSSPIIGGWSNLSTYDVSGYISNLRILKGTALYTSTFTPSTTPLTAIANTSLLTCQSNRLIDNSINNFTLTRNGDVSVQALDPFGSVPEATPISYSVYFDGTGDYLDSATSSAFTYGTGDFTIEFWAYLTAIGGTPNLIDQRGGTHPSVRPTLFMNSGVLTYYTNGGATIVGSTLSTNVWYHIALSRNSGTTRLFVNGSQVGSSYTDGNNYTSTKVRVFTDDSGGSTSQAGYCSNLRILKGTGLYTTTFTPSTTPLTAIANTSLLTCQSTRMIDNSTNAFTITATGNTIPRIFNPFGYTAQSTTSYTPSLHGGSVYLDGTGDYLTTASNAVFTYGTSNFTVEGWHYLTAAASVTKYLFDQRVSGNGLFPAIYVSSGSYIVYINSGVALTAGVVISNAWVHWALVKNNSTTTLYINGISAGSFADTNNYSTTALFRIGSEWSLSGSYDWQGYMSDLRVVKGTAVYTSNFVPPTQALTSLTTAPASLLLNFNNGGIIDQHSSNVLETLGNAQLSTSVKKYNNASMYFDGTGDYLYAPPNLNYAMGSGDFTIEFWYYPVSQNAAWNPNIMGNYGTTWTTNKWAFHAPHSSAAGKYSFWVNNIVTQPLLASTSNVTNGAWVYLTITRSGSTWRMFVNGTIEATATSSAALDGGTAASMDGLYIGANFYSGEGGRYINAYIDDLRFTKGYARYTANFTPPTSALITK